MKKESAPLKELKLTEKALRQITYLCSKINDTEWSGVMFYKLLKGDVNDIKSDIEVEIKEIFLMDIGTGAYTEFEYIDKSDTRLLDLYDKHPELMDYRMGDIHSHHSMKAFFSGTDSDELKKGSKNADHYLMLIVNNDDYTEWVSKIGVVYDIIKDSVKTVTYYNNVTKKFNVKEKGSEFLSHELKIKIEDDHNLLYQDINEQIANTKKIKDAKKVNNSAITNFYNYENPYNNINDIRSIGFQRNDVADNASNNSFDDVSTNYSLVYKLLNTTGIPSSNLSTYRIISDNLTFYNDNQEEYARDILISIEDYIDETNDKLGNQLSLYRTDDDDKRALLELIISNVKIYDDKFPIVLSELKSELNKLKFQSYGY
jgi:hypothetical protein